MRSTLGLLLLVFGISAAPLDAPAQNCGQNPDCVAIGLRLEWRSGGSVKLDSTQKLTFPDDVEEVPGLYRFELRGEKTWVYIGESENLRRRFAQYRSPGRTQKTNHRICAAMRSTLLAGGTVLVSVVTKDAWLCPHAGCVAAQLGSENQRKLLEQLAILFLPPDALLLNRDKFIAPKSVRTQNIGARETISRPPYVCS